MTRFDILIGKPPPAPLSEPVSPVEWTTFYMGMDLEQPYSQNPVSNVRGSQTGHVQTNGKQRGLSFCDYAAEGLGNETITKN